MILSKQDLKFYLLKDKQALGISRKHPKFIGDDIWKFQISLRYCEYFTNIKQKGLFNNLKLKLFKLINYHYGIKCGFEIPINVFDYGLRINHKGTIVINPHCKIGKWCDLHVCVNIGENIEGVSPIIGDNCWIGPGTKIFGKVQLGNHIMIGAGSIVNKSFIDNNITIAGCPAKKIKDIGEPYNRS